MAKKTIYVSKGFDFTADDGSVTKFKPGKHVVDEAVANHWFVQAHLEEEREEPAAESKDSGQQAPAQGGNAQGQGRGQNRK